MVPKGNDAVERARALLAQRLRELDAERDRVEKAIADLGGRRGPGRPRGSRKSASARGGGGGRRRRQRRGGTRADEALKIVAADPGISAGKIAKQIGIAPNYMYRVMGALEKDGRVRKKGRGYHPAG